MDPLPSILKFFNAIIHISPKCLVRFLTIKLFSVAAEHVVVLFVCFSFIEHVYKMFKVFSEILDSYIQSFILSNSVRDC